MLLHCTEFGWNIEQFPSNVTTVDLDRFINQEASYVHMTASQNTT